MKIASKIIIHILISLTLALSIAGIGIYHYLEANYFDDAKKSVHYAFREFLSEEERRKEHLVQMAQVFQQREDLIDLIKRANAFGHEDKSEMGVHHEIRQELIREISETIATTALYAVGIYDNQGRLKCHIEQDEQETVRSGCVVWDQNQQPVFIRYAENDLIPDKWFAGVEFEKRLGNLQQGVQLRVQSGQLAFVLTVPLFSSGAADQEPMGFVQAVEFVRGDEMMKISRSLGIELGYLIKGANRVVGSDNLKRINLSQLHWHELESHDEIDLFEQEHFYVESAVQKLDDGNQLILLGAVDKKQIEEGLDRTIQMLLFVLGVAVAVVIPGGVWLARRHITEPISRLDRAVEHVKRGQVQELLPIADSDDEIGHLAASFNEMAVALQQREEDLLSLNCSLEDRIAEAIEESKGKDSIIHEQEKRSAMTELLVNISHHWRQPLNIMSITAQNLEFSAEDPIELKKSIETITMEAENLSHTLSLFGNLFKQKNLQEKIYLELVVRKTIERFCEFHKGLDVESCVEIGEGLSALGSFKILEEIVTSLLDNSKEAAERQKCTPLKVTVKAKQLTDSVELTYEDNAGGIDEDVLPKIFDPYFTTQFKSRNKGLGLYLVKSLMEANLEGMIIADNSENGARFTLWLKSTEIPEDSS